MSEKRVPKERIQLYLRPEICAWLAGQVEGRNKPAGEALESWIIEKEYPTVRDRYCRGLSDVEILKLNKGEIAEMAEDDDIPLVWMILQGGARRAVASVAEVPDKFPVVLDPKMRTDEWRLRNNNPHLVKLPDAEAVPVVLDPTMMLEGYEARAADMPDVALTAQQKAKVRALMEANDIVGAQRMILEILNLAFEKLSHESGNDSSPEIQEKSKGRASDVDERAAFEEFRKRVNGMS